MKNYKSDEPCVCCGLIRDGEVTYHHLITRGAGGTDEEHNLISVCQRHHNEFHQLGTVKMSQIFPKVEKWLLDRNWYFCEFSNKWRYLKS